MAKDNDTIVEGKNLEPKKHDTKALFAKGKEHYDKGEYDEAEKYWGEAADLGDDNARTALVWLDGKTTLKFLIERGVLKKYLGKGGDVEIPSNVTSIGDGAFGYCSSLTGVEIPSSVKSIGVNPFAGCVTLDNIKVARYNDMYCAVCNCLIDIVDKKLISGCKFSVIPPDGRVKSIGNLAFSGLSSLMSIAIPDSVTSIGFSAFGGCSSLISIVIPDGVKSIGEYAFYDCESLAEITIPRKIKIIGDGAFKNCAKLKKIVFSGSKAEWEKIKKVSAFDEKATVIVCCKDGTIKLKS